MAKLIAHQFLGIAIAYYALRPANIIQAFMYGGLALLGSMAPDLDGLHRHRASLHSLFACLITGLAVYISLYVAEALGLAPANLYPMRSSAAYMLAYLSHLLADIPTGHGVALLYPLTDKRIGFLGLRYDNIVYNALLIATATVLLYVFFTSAPTPYSLIRGQGSCSIVEAPMYSKTGIIGGVSLWVRWSSVQA